MCSNPVCMRGGWEGRDALWPFWRKSASAVSVCAPSDLGTAQRSEVVATPLAGAKRELSTVLDQSLDAEFRVMPESDVQALVKCDDEDGGRALPHEENRGPPAGPQGSAPDGQGALRRPRGLGPLWPSPGQAHEVHSHNIRGRVSAAPAVAGPEQLPHVAAVGFPSGQL